MILCHSNINKKQLQFVLRFPNELHIGSLSASEIWKIFSEDIQNVLLEHEQNKSCTTADYMNLQFKVKWFYDDYVVKLESFELALLTGYSKWEVTDLW